MIRLAPVAAAVWLASSPLAIAQVAPDALWSAWQQGAGFVSATGTAEPDGDALVVEGPRINIGALRLEAGSLRLVPDGDATVIDLPDTFTMTQGDISADVSAADLTLRAAGDPTNPTYTLIAPQMDAALSGQSLTADLIATAVDATIAPDATQANIDRLAITSETAGFSASRDGVDLLIDGPLDALTALAAGEAGSDVAITLNASETAQTSTLPDGRGTLRTVTGPSEEAASASDGTVSLSQSVSAIDLSLDTAALPIEAATFAIDTATWSVTGPAATRSEPSPMAVDLALNGITASEDLWQLFDPAETLSRDPAELRLAFSADVTRDSASSYTAQRAALETLRLSVLGTELTGQGAAIFSRPDAPYGRPVGTFAFTLTGAVELLDRLQALGTLPGGPLMGARMGLGFFTRPGSEDGELTSSVKIGPDGIVTVNEQQIYQIPLRAAPGQ
ncbi:hypothetical protein PARPLA_00411 [Rhodobacteraceae bacterium THAF1]|uniref:DUF2125 domain-containing protein n=1 Tax=Palleronia sp. THAF1 TaxID=2587842 RepID=UPI000F3FDF1B|nr:DUF2125 domain-containing protein [Palleronia sp. THAF1]QFU10026.1 hypothetical protein FIU81_15205 [Palleronia sp. THAF1]VDC17069.1 hypothetical protein PARPLA_00411 [Rhodobacteraceae bacterium THAF1]